MSSVREASALSYDAIREYAERVGVHYAIYDRMGTGDVRELVARLGGTVAYGDTRESLHVDRPGSFTIFLPHVTSSRRDRFTIAHELGHYFLHYLHARRESPATFGRGLRDTLETQANVFAASLLMPTHRFTQAFHRCGGDVFRLARTFDVSPQAVEVRAQVLGLQ